MTIWCKTCKERCIGAVQKLTFPGARKGAFHCGHLRRRKHLPVEDCWRTLSGTVAEGFVAPIDHVHIPINWRRSVIACCSYHRSFRVSQTPNVGSTFPRRDHDFSASHTPTQAQFRPISSVADGSGIISSHGCIKSGLYAKSQFMSSVHTCVDPVLYNLQITEQSSL